MATLIESGWLLLICMEVLIFMTIITVCCTLNLATIHRHLLTWTGMFKLTLQFSEDYPNKPPTVRFVSRMFHPNIYADGSIFLDILQNQWSPIYDVAAILTSIQSLLYDPNPNSSANSKAVECSVRTSGNTTGKCVKLLSRAGQQTKQTT